ncbi:MAG TPA: FAD-dependent oxidoreductase [Limnochordia bacterium]
MTYEVIESDLTVVGAGIAGIAAAVEAARSGLKVALINDRPVLGGNSSSEIRVWINGATGGRNNRYAREGGIVEEMILRNRHDNPDGNAHLWDMLLYDLVRAEPNLTVFLNTLITDVEMAGPRQIAAVAGHQLMSERHFRFCSPYFIDASGDGVVAAGAGAEYRVGREPKSLYGERWAPDEADRRTLGSSIMFYSKDAGYPVPYRPPSFARDFKQNPPRVLEQRTNPKDPRCCWWWFEWGGELDTIRDNEKIRDELLAIVYGAWDYIKNSGRFQGVQNLQLEWVGSLPGKRESRRFVGEYVLTEHDIVEQRSFPDTVAHGGWSIDLHPPKGFYDATGEASRHWHPPGPYEIPYRILVSKDLDNLWLVGRLVSASHVAFGSLRVQMTLGAIGQAAGAGVAVAHRYGLTARAVGEEKIGAVQQLLLRDDQWVIGVPNADPEDAALRAVAVRASSTHPFGADGADEAHALERELALTLPYPPGTRRVALQFEAAAPIQFEIGLWTPARWQNYIPERHHGGCKVALSGGRQSVTIPLEGIPADAGSVVLRLPAVAGARLWGTKRELTGVLAAAAAPGAHEMGWRLLPWIPAFEADGPTPYAPENVKNGYARPYGRPNCWLSAPMGEGPEWVELEWTEPVEVGFVQVAFNSILTPNYLHLVRQSSPAVSTIVRDYRILLDGEAVAAVEGNYRRLVRHAFSPRSCRRLRLEVVATHGAPCAEVFEIRAYPRDPRG